MQCKLVDHLSFSQFHVPAIPEPRDCAVIDSDDDFDSLGTVQSSLHEHLQDCAPNLRPPSPPYSLRQCSFLNGGASGSGAKSSAIQRQEEKRELV
jgi:hypothetical protein